MTRKLKPSIIRGEIFEDHRGKLFSNNSFDLREIRRIYKIENINTDYERGWKGHKIEKRWFYANKGTIEIQVESIMNLENRDYFNPRKFLLDDAALDILFVPPGYATLIVQKQKGASVIAMSNYLLHTTEDDLRFDP